MKQIHIHAMVKNILTEYPATRNDDTMLFLKVCERYCPMVCNMRFSAVLAEADKYGVPNFESVSRARRKIQAGNPDLIASDKTLDARYDKWKEMREYATS